ncbi:DNA damage-induced apoptosis suppressor protein [Eublepharis macularius]|uniref:DNA damage-induced apoptosis suppressor protein n=1 Tax=Eublepharis macularius TaxID=481883 RepID=A0AA97J3M6_EUBMA|nr:DNA damage-induced apoptosis suppressor protein [Eublepharis macularius]
MNGRRRFLTASVISVQNSTFVYPSCQNCFSKLYLDLERYSCLKCGCSGDAREASYRYRLSLEVADAHEVFLVTVFGSCLEAFFGVTAKSLQRYIEDLVPDAGEATRDTSPSVVFQAVETCFIGKKFVFGVKKSEKQDGASHLQSHSQVDRHSKVLTACQMFVPNPGLVGCTVIRYLHQHRRRSSSSKGSHGGVWSPGDVFTALDQPSSELSCLHGSGDWDPVPSSHRDCLSNLWPQSFGLTSSSISRGTAVNAATSGANQATCDEQKWDDRLVSLQPHDQSIDNSQDGNLTVSEKNLQEDDELCLCSTWRDSIIFKKNAQSHSSERDDSRSLQNPLEIGKKSSPNKINIWHRHGPEKPPNPLLCQRQGYSFCPPILCTGHSRDGGSSQDDSWLWDELPSSESLDEFIARIEKSKAMVSPTETETRGHVPSKGAGEIQGHVNPSSLQLGAASTTGEIREKLQEVAEKVDVFKESVSPRHWSNWSSLSGKEYQQEASFTTSSTQRKDDREYLSSHHQILPHLSLLGTKPSSSKGSCLSSKEGVGQDVNSCENHCASSSLKASSNCLENLARLNCKCEGNVTGWRKKENSHCELKQISDLTDVQEQGFTLAACDKQERVCEREPFPEVQGGKCTRGEISNLLLDSSLCPQGSYNASADLFDTNAAGVEVVEGILTAEAFSAQEGALTTKSTASGYKPSELEASWTASQNGLSLLDLFATCEPRASTPVAGSAVELECSPLGTQYFVPPSQSTPRVRPCQQVRLPKGKESNLSELPLNKLPWIDAEWKRPRPAFKAPLVKQLVSKFLQSRRSSTLSSAATDTSITQGLFVNTSRAQGLAEDDGEECIPPSEEKWMQPLPFQHRKMFGSRRRSRDLAEKTLFSEKRKRWEVPRGTTGVARTEFTDRSQPPAEAAVHEDVADCEQVMVVSPGFCTFSNGIRLNLSSTPHCTPCTGNWSPELFGDNSSSP